MKRILIALVVAIQSVFASPFAPTIPVVDMNDFYDVKRREHFIESVKNALHEVGFFAMINTGISSEVISEAFSSVEDFFHLDQEVKEKYSAPWTNKQRGYVTFRDEIAKGAKKSDCKEYYHFGRLFSEEQLERLGYPPNIWPEEIDFKRPIEAYLKELDSYAKEMRKVFALALEQQEDFFDPMLEEGQGFLRVVHYPLMQKEDKLEGAMWAAPHTDINLFTLLPEATAEGLEILLSDGTWQRVFATGDAIIVNAGDFMEIFSNGYFKSSCHRVVASRGEEGYERYSMVYFMHPRDQDVLYPLPEFIRKEGRQKFAIATRTEMFNERMVDNHQASEDTIKDLANSQILERLIDVGRASPDAVRVLKERGLASPKLLRFIEGIDSEDEK